MNNLFDLDIEVFSEKYATVNGVKLHFIKGGSGPLLLLWHGFLATWYGWRKIMPELAKTYAVIVPDMRDFGDSDKPESAALAMTDKRFSNGTFELSSPGLFSRVDLAAIMTEHLGKAIIAKDMPVDEWAKQVQIPPGELRDGLIAMNKEYDKHRFSGGNALILETILGHEACTVPQFINELK